MSDDKPSLYDLEARIAALEYLLRHTLWNVIVARVDADGGDDSDAIREARLLVSNMSEDLQTATFPGVDPALSDHLAAVSRDHALAFLRRLLQEMEADTSGSP